MPLVSTSCNTGEAFLALAPAAIETSSSITQVPAATTAAAQSRRWAITGPGQALGASPGAAVLRLRPRGRPRGLAICSGNAAQIMPAIRISGLGRRGSARHGTAQRPGSGRFGLGWLSIGSLRKPAYCCNRERPHGLICEPRHSIASVR
jgi:hypothetical protein